MTMPTWVINQWYYEDRPICPVCNTVIEKDQVYIIENTDPVKHYWCVKK